MSADGSAWTRVLGASRTAALVPAMADVVVPRDRLVRAALDAPHHWIVGPPKVGKTVLAHYLAYFAALGRPDAPLERRVKIFDGQVSCAQGIEILIEDPDDAIAAVVLENPLGTLDGRDAAALAARLEVLRERHPRLKIVATSRQRPYIDARDQLSPTATATPLGLGEWYDPDDLWARFHATTPGLTREVAADLGCPALILQLRDHGVKPSPGRRAETRRKYGEASDEMTLDKLDLLSDRDDLAELAMVLRLQEHAFALPTIDDLSTILERRVAEIDDFGLVATRFVFDGEERLRFEHSTTREAAEMLLRKEVATGRRRLGALLARPPSDWLRSAYERWDAERRVGDGRWDLVSEISPDVLADVAGQMVLHADGDPNPLDIVSNLDMDAWTAQDVAYALAVAWSPSATRPQRQLARRVAQDRAAHGAYALLEALLYVRGPQVDDLWSIVENEYGELVDDGPPWLPDPLAVLILGVDALAWRPPPEDRTTHWLDRFLAQVGPDDDAWALVRFLRGYHLDGLRRYLGVVSPALMDAALIDEGREWTDGQGELGRWLVQWHFVHQCRARAQFAHQPWVDQEYLGRTFHEKVVDADRDRNAADLIRSITAAPGQHAGWGYFLTENLRAVSPESVGPLARAEGRVALQAAGPLDKGVLAAVLTYEPDPALAEMVVAHFADPEARDLLFDTLLRGLAVGAVRLVEPRFSHRRRLGAIYRSCGVEWPQLRNAIPAADAVHSDGDFDADGFVRRFTEAIETIDLGGDLLVRQRVDDLLHKMSRGDLRALEASSFRAPSGASEETSAADSVYVRLARSVVEGFKV